MKIEILSPEILGKEYVRSVKQALTKIKVDGDVVLVSDTSEIDRKSNSLKLPIMMVNGEIKATGKVLNESEVCGILEEVISKKSSGNVKKRRYFLYVYTTALEVRWPKHI
jgi:hypothetical protein